MPLKERLSEVQKKVLPNSSVSMSKGALDNTTLFVQVFLGRSREEMPGGIALNDPLNVRLDIYENDNGSYTVEPRASITGLKPVQPYMAYSSRKIRTRKFIGSEDKVVDNFEKLLNRVKTELASAYHASEFKCQLPYDISEKL